jgi:hypothetical protein
MDDGSRGVLELFVIIIMIVIVILINDHDWSEPAQLGADPWPLRTFFFNASL